MKTKKKTRKKSIKQNRTASARQVSARRRIGCPGVGMFKMKDLEPAGYNPREIDAEALEGLTNSISRFGCVEPIVINTRGRHNVIVGGNQRFKALQDLGVTECLCVSISCSQADEKLLNLTLNNPLIQGDFIKKIEDYIEQLRRELPDDKDFLSLRIADLQNELGRFPGKTGRVPDDDIPRIPRKVTTRPGDLWTLGNHRLLCGDSTKGPMVSRLMAGSKADLFATDPPYCVDYTGTNRPAGGKNWSEQFREIEILDPKKFMKDYLSVGLNTIKKKTAIYLWHASRRRGLVDEVCAELKILVHQQIIWVKPCIVFGYAFYPWRHEPCVLMWKRGDMPPFKSKSKSIGTVWPVGYNKTGDPTSPEYYQDVWELDYEGKKRPGGLEHPTVKPVEVFAIPMRVHTSTGGICYEPFCGSGSQIIAAEKLDRRCYAMETGDTKELENLEVLRRFLKTTWISAVDLDLKFFIYKSAIDTGYRPEVAKDFCSQCKELDVIPVRGDLSVRTRPFRAVKIAGGTMIRYDLNVNDYKSRLYRLLFESAVPGPGYWHLNADTTDETLSHLTAEEQRMIHSHRRQRYELLWVLKKEHMANHIWDCKVYSSFAAEMIGAHSLPSLEETKPQRPKKKLSGRSGWLDDLPVLR